RHHAAGEIGAAEPRQVHGRQRDAAAQGPDLVPPHPTVERERVHEEQPLGHRGGVTTRSAFGTTSNVAGSGPTCSPSAYTSNRRSADTSKRLPRSVETIRSRTCVPRNTEGNLRRNRGFDIAPITVTSSSPSVNEAPG